MSPVNVSSSSFRVLSWQIGVTFPFTLTSMTPSLVSSLPNSVFSLQAPSISCSTRLHSMSCHWSSSRSIFAKIQLPFSIGLPPRPKRHWRNSGRQTGNTTPAHQTLFHTTLPGTFQYHTKPPQGQTQQTQEKDTHPHQNQHRRTHTHCDRISSGEASRWLEAPTTSPFSSPSSSELIEKKHWSCK